MKLKPPMKPFCAAIALSLSLCLSSCTELVNEILGPDQPASSGSSTPSSSTPLALGDTLDTRPVPR